MWRAWETQRPRRCASLTGGAGPRSPPGPRPSPRGGSKQEDFGLPFVDTERLTPGCPPQSDMAFPASRPRGSSDPPGVSLRLTPPLFQQPLQPASQRVLSVTKTSRMGKVPHLTSNWKSGASSFVRGILFWYSHRQPSPACAQGPASIHHRLAADGGIVM